MGSFDNELSDIWTATIRRLAQQASMSGVTASDLLNTLGIDHDRYNNGGVSEVIKIALADGDDADWLQEQIETAGNR